MSLNSKLISSLVHLTHRGSEFKNFGPATEKALLPVFVFVLVHLEMNRHILLNGGSNVLGDLARNLGTEVGPSVMFYTPLYQF